jgi:hypothetical protein
VDLEENLLHVHKGKFERKAMRNVTLADSGAP